MKNFIAKLVLLFVLLAVAAAAERPVEQPVRLKRPSAGRPASTKDITDLIRSIEHDGFAPIWKGIEKAYIEIDTVRDTANYAVASADTARDTANTALADAEIAYDLADTSRAWMDSAYSSTYQCFAIGPSGDSVKYTVEAGTFYVDADQDEDTINFTASFSSIPIVLYSVMTEDVCTKDSVGIIYRNVDWVSFKKKYSETFNMSYWAVGH